MTNMLIVQGEFIKWFTINFADEGQEEEDFLKGVNDKWYSTVTLGLELISKFNTMSSIEKE